MRRRWIRWGGWRGERGERGSSSMFLLLLSWSWSHKIQILEFASIYFRFESRRNIKQFEYSRKNVSESHPTYKCSMKGGLSCQLWCGCRGWTRLSNKLTTVKPKIKWHQVLGLQCGFCDLSMRELQCGYYPLGWVVWVISEYCTKGNTSFKYKD